MYRSDRASPMPIDSQLRLDPDDLENEVTESSTPELNLLLDKLTEILRFRSACRRQYNQPQQHLPATSNLKRLQSGGIEPIHLNTDMATLHTTTGAWKSSTVHPKSAVSGRSSNSHHHHHHHHCQQNRFSNEKKRRLPCLLQRLIDDGNLIKEAVRRLKSQRFTSDCPSHNNRVNTPTTPTTKSSFSNLTLSSGSITIPQALNDSPNQMNSSPTLGLSWFLSSNRFPTSNHTSDNGSPLRTLMEIGIHDR